jgi:hypothetical protein
MRVSHIVLIEDNPADVLLVKMALDIARLGLLVTGIDPSTRSVLTAQEHAGDQPAPVLAMKKKKGGKSDRIRLLKR